MDKVYKRKNLELAWIRVKQNGGAGGIDGQSLSDFEAMLAEQLDRLEQELRCDTYQPLPVRRHLIPKAGQPGKSRPLGIPAIYDRVCQQALLNRLEPIFEPVFDDASFGYRKGRSTKDALRKIWKELAAGAEWIVDADLKDFFGSADQDKLVTLVAQRIADGRVLRLIRRMLQSGVLVEGQFLPTEQGVPQGEVISPVLSNVLLTPFDREMRRRGTLDHAHLRDLLQLRVRDGVLLRLIGKWLNAGVLEEGSITHPETGTPQGGVITPPTILQKNSP